MNLMPQTIGFARLQRAGSKVKRFNQSVELRCADRARTARALSCYWLATYADSQRESVRRSSAVSDSSNAAGTGSSTRNVPVTTCRPRGAVVTTPVCRFFPALCGPRRFDTQQFDRFALFANQHLPFRL